MILKIFVEISQVGILKRTLSNFILPADNSSWNIMLDPLGKGATGTHLGHRLHD